jgi:hypothetical protein
MCARYRRRCELKLIQVCESLLLFPIRAGSRLSSMAVDDDSTMSNHYVVPTGGR